MTRLIAIMLIRSAWLILIASTGLALYTGGNPGGLASIRGCAPTMSAAPVCYRALSHQIGWLHATLRDKISSLS